ncbi:MAG: CRISPR-associated protein Cas4, partial [Peptostreptococcaceae bacterium]
MVQVNGTLINYYFHCKRQCYLHANRLNLEDNSELVKIGKAIHEEKAKDKKVSEVKIDNIKIDKITSEYLIEIKKSDADIVASKWQLLYYLKKLKEKGIDRKGKLEFVEKNKIKGKTIMIELDSITENGLEEVIQEINDLTKQEDVPKVLNKPKCKKCA